MRPAPEAKDDSNSANGSPIQPAFNHPWFEELLDKIEGCAILMLDAEGRLYASEGVGRRVVRYEPAGGVTVLADQFEGRRLNSPNDLAIDAHHLALSVRHAANNERTGREPEHA